MLNLLFVYGTLRFNENPISEGLNPVCNRLGTASVCGKLFDLGNYPGMVLSKDPQDKVIGEVIALSNPGKSLAMIDRYEGIFPGPGSEYQREVTEVTFKHQLTPCWIYVYQHSLTGLSRITSGDYVDYLSQHQP